MNALGAAPSSRKQYLAAGPVQRAPGLPSEGAAGALVAAPGPSGAEQPVAPETLASGALSCCLQRGFLSTGGQYRFIQSNFVEQN